jgi:hypothetical protein
MWLDYHKRDIRSCERKTSIGLGCIPLIKLSLISLTNVNLMVLFQPRSVQGPCVGIRRIHVLNEGLGSKLSLILLD